MTMGMSNWLTAKREKKDKGWR